MISNSKRENGQYFTRGNCFTLHPFREWFEAIPNHDEMVLVEPFAGGGDIPRLMRDAGYSNDWSMFDLCPQHQRVQTRDSIACCPAGDCIITNPPYLARNSAKRRRLGFPDTVYDDLYKLALERMLDVAPYVAAIVPESFLTSGLFLDRVSRVISLRIRMFDDTDCPVCLALFSSAGSVLVYSNDVEIGDLVSLQAYLPKADATSQWLFNSPVGDVGLIAVDNTRGESIRFVRGGTIPSSCVKVSSRSITRVLGDGAYPVDSLLLVANDVLCELRRDTQDVFLTAFKGMRQDGRYRRRLDFGLARCILDVAKSRCTSGVC